MCALRACALLFDALNPAIYYQPSVMRTCDGHEVCPALIGHCSCQQRLAGAGWTKQQDALGGCTDTLAGGEGGREGREQGHTCAKFNTVTTGVRLTSSRMYIASAIRMGVCERVCINMPACMRASFLLGAGRAACPSPVVQST